MIAASLPYVIFGVTGRTGAAAADALLRAGHPVRVVVRDRSRGQPWAARGAEVAMADLTDLDAVTMAMRGVRGGYVICPQSYGQDDLFERAALIARTTAQAAVAARLPGLVALSSVGADRNGGTGWIAMNRAFEQCLGETGIATTFLRAAYFMENWAPMVGHAVRTGTLPSFLGPAQRSLSMGATVDVGAAAAAALLSENWSGNRVVTLGGPGDYAPDDVAGVLAATLGKPVDVAVLPEAAWPDALADAQFSAAALAGFIEMTRGLNSGHIDIGSDARAVAWVGTTGLSQVIAELAGALHVGVPA